MGDSNGLILDADDKLFQDGLENLVAQLGTERDKRSHSVFVNAKRLSAEGGQEELNALYRTDWLAGKVVDIIPDDMCREWRSFTGDIDPEIVTTLEEEEDRLELSFNFNLCHKWSRLYGTSFIVMDIDDGQSPEEPLDFNRIKEGSLKHIKTLDRHQMSHQQSVPVTDPFNPNFGFPEYYYVHESTVRIHYSRVLRFDGVRIPYHEFRRNNYYSDSILDRLYDALTNFNTASNSAASMIYETNVDVMKIKGLMSYLSSSEGESLLRKRFALAGQLKSFNNMLLLDQEEDWQTQSNTFAGLPDLLDRYALFLSGASDIPATRLLGSSANGLNATGEGDLKNYYDAIRSIQKREYKPKLNYFDRIMFASLGIDYEESKQYEFNSLFQMTPKEISDMNFVDSQRDQIYLINGVITEDIVAKELKQNDVYTNIDDDYIRELEEFELGGDDDEGGFNTDPENLRGGEQSEIEGEGEEESGTGKGD